MVSLSINQMPRATRLFSKDNWFRRIIRFLEMHHIINSCTNMRKIYMAIKMQKVALLEVFHDTAKSSLLAEVSHDETNWNKRRETSAGFRRVSYHACPRVSLTTSDVFVTCDTTQRTGLNLGASGRWIWARAQILNGPIRVEDETTLRAAVVLDPITSLWGKPKRRISRQIFRSLRVFRPAKHT